MYCAGFEDVQELGTSLRVWRMFPMDNLRLPPITPVFVAAASTIVSSIPSLALWHARRGHTSSSRVQHLASISLLSLVSKENFDCVDRKSVV